MAAFLRPARSMRPSIVTSSRNVSNVFLQLPPTYRAFHASPRPQFLDSAMTVTHTLLEGLHSATGLPWAATIPLAALTIRTVLVLPISIYSRRSNQKQAQLSPLIAAWQHNLQKETMQKVGHLGPQVAQREMLKKLRAKRKEIFARWDCPQWRSYLPIVQLPVWLVAIETIRKMCGANTGLLGMIAERFSSNAGEKIPDILGGGSFGMEESFSTEGVLWFQNLLLPDPQLILPFALSGVILLNLSGTGGNQSRWRRRLTNSFRILALAIGPLTLQLPSGMLLYWISSTSFAYIQAKVLDKVMPVKSPVVPCKPKRYLPNGQAMNSEHSDQPR
ncbi:60Kd inner membrane protein-domain-containing protein [Xylogone sp. PMI_703]|nr:60Kd inner membrane protein-domain-containing protein [Xylogone sp. PMI_703]